jgi:hypothetical protein
MFLGKSPILPGIAYFLSSCSLENTEVYGGDTEIDQPHFDIFPFLLYFLCALCLFIVILFQKGTTYFVNTHYIH